MKNFKITLFIVIVSMNVCNAQNSMALISGTYEKAMEAFDMLSENNHLVQCTHHGYLIKDQTQHFTIKLFEGFDYYIGTMALGNECKDLDMEIYQVGDDGWVKVFEDTEVGNNAVINFKCFKTQQYVINLIPYEMMPEHEVASYVTIVSFIRKEYE